MIHAGFVRRSIPRNQTQTTQINHNTHIQTHAPVEQKGGVRDHHVGDGGVDAHSHGRPAAAQELGQGLADGLKWWVVGLILGGWMAWVNGLVEWVVYVHK